MIDKNIDSIVEEFIKTEDAQNMLNDKSHLNGILMSDIYKMIGGDTKFSMFVKRSMDYIKISSENHGIKYIHQSTGGRKIVDYIMDIPETLKIIFSYGGKKSLNIINYLIGLLSSEQIEKITKYIQDNE